MGGQEQIKAQRVRREWAHQTAILLYFWKSDTVFRVFTSFAAFGLLLALSNLRLALVAFAPLFLAEVLVLSIAFTYARKRFRITPQIFFAVALLNAFTNIAYAVPALGFYQIETWAGNFVGVLWLAGITIYTASTYRGIQIFFWINYLPGALALLGSGAVFYISSSDSFSFAELVIVSIATALYLINGFDIYRRQRETQRQLEQARRDADDRLMELEYLSQFDPLTNLPIRASFESRLNVLLGRSMHRSAHFAVGLIDLDNFKPINDSFGHHAGDAVLKEIASRLKGFARHPSDVARLGGDEFAIVFVDAMDQATAQKKGDELADLLSMPVLYDEATLNVGASIGISLTRTEGRDRSTLMKRADIAMYDAKRRREASAVVYDKTTISTSTDLTQKPLYELAIANKEILPFYQPKVDLLTGNIVGLEALARWEKPDGSVVLPADFIPQIDDLGLMHEFTYAITRQVINDIGRWRDMGFDALPVSTNVGERILATSIGLQDMLWIVSESKLPPNILTFEVTEDVVLGRAGDFIRSAISALSEEGVRISLDDFGTGFASFRHLEELHLDELKIDTSFVTKIGKTPSAKVIIEGFLGIAAGLGIEVVAEGVETEAQRDFLLKRGCRVGQGFLFSKAVSFVDISKLLLAEERKSVL